MTHAEENVAPEFVIHNRKEIAAIIGGLMKSRTAISLNTQSGVNLLTSVLHVSHEVDHIYLGISPDNRINDQIIYSKQVDFSTQTGIKVRWHSTHLHRAALPDNEALATPIPEAIERIQRRDSFRIKTPQSKDALICKIPVDENIFELLIFDMSTRGICVLVKGTLPVIFTQGGLLAHCSIEFTEVGIVPVGLRVCRIWEAYKTNSGEQVTCIGMEFVNLSRGAENVFQRHINQLQAKNLANYGVI